MASLIGTVNWVNTKINEHFFTPFAAVGCLSTLFHSGVEGADEVIPM